MKCWQGLILDFVMQLIVLNV
uniref:Uncharacterized protein n=1 Tax=Arundo donax TaxID=35708 RepID=A0A0A9C286_ARUDO